MTTHLSPQISGGEQDIINVERSPVRREVHITHQWIEQQVQKNRQYFRNFRNKCKKADTFVLGEFDFETAEGATKLRLGTAHSVVKTLVDHITPPFIDISVPPPGTRGSARAERIENFLRGSTHRLEQETPTRREVNMHMAMYGVAWEKTECEMNRWSDIPYPPEDTGGLEQYMEELDRVFEKRAIDFPIIATCVNPQKLLWDTNNGDKPRWIIYEYEVEASWLHAHFPGHEKEIPTSGMVEFQEIWTHSQYAYRSNRKWIVAPSDHGYGTMPWVMYWPKTGLNTIGNKPEHLYRGMLDGNFEMIEAESRLQSQYLDIISKSAWRTLDFYGPAGSADEVMEIYDQTPGARNRIPQNVEVKPSQIAEPPQSLVIAQQGLDAKIAANTAPSVARGERPRGAASGYETAVLSGIARLNFAAYVEASQRGLQKRNSLILNIVELVLRDRITVWGRTEVGPLEASLSPKDIKGFTVNFVQLNPTAPEEAERKLQLWMQLWQAKYVDHETALREGGVNNPVTVRAKLLAEKFMEGEAVSATLEREAAARIPIISEILDAASNGNSATADATADRILGANAGGFNAGQFSSVQQPMGTLGGEQARVATNATRPVIPGSAGEADLVARQISSPARDGSVRVPTSNLPAGLGR